MEDDERKKKLEAGKEKLAAFRKRKAKKKKRLPGDAASCGESVQEGADGNSADISSSSDIQSFTGDESEMHSAIYYQTKLADSKRRVAELEEIIEGKQLALDRLVQENECLHSEKKSLEKKVLSEPGQSAEQNKDIRMDSQGKVRLQDLQSALAQRDGIIQQLTARLRASAETNIPQDYQAETSHLAQQVALLQQQLRQAGEAVRGQMNQHTESSQALQEAKAEILTLQDRIQEKDSILAQVTQKFSRQSEEVLRLSQTCETFHKREAELQTLVQQLSEEIAIEKSERAKVLSLGSDEQGKFHRLAEQLNALGCENDRLAAELSVFKSQNTDLQSANDQFQEETTLRQVENEELRNKINTKQGEVIGLRSHLEILKEENGQYRVEMETLRQKFNEREEVFEAEINQKKNCISELEGEIQKLKEEEISYKDTINSLNVKIQSLQTDLNMAWNKNMSDKSEITDLQAQLLQLKALVSHSENIKTDVTDHIAGQSEMEGSVEFHGQSDLEIRQLAASTEATHHQISEHVGDEMSLSPGGSLELRSQSEVSQRFLEEKVISMEQVKALGSSYSPSLDEQRIQKSEDEHFKEQTSRMTEHISSLEHQLQISEEKCEKFVALESQHEQLVEENRGLKSDLMEFEARRSAESRMQVEMEKSSSEVQRLNTQLENVEKELKNSRQAVKDISEQLIVSQNAQVELQTTCDQQAQSINRQQERCAETEEQLEMAKSEFERIQTKYFKQCEKQATEIGRLHEALDHAESKKKDEENADLACLQKKCEDYVKEIASLQNELAETRSGLEEVHLGAEHGEKVLQTECQKYSQQVNQLTLELEQVQNLLAAMKIESEEIKDENKSKHDDLQTRCDEHAAENCKLQADLEQVKSELDRVKLESERSREEIQSKCDDYSRETNRLQFSVDELRKELELVKQRGEETSYDLQRKLENSEAELEQVKVEFEDFKETAERNETNLESRYEISQSEVKELRHELDQSKAMLEEFRHSSKNSQADLQLQCANYAADVSKLQSKLKEAEEKLIQTESSLCTQCQTLLTEASRVQTELKEARMELEEVRSSEQTCRNDLQAQCDKHFSEVEKLQADLAQAKRELERLSAEEQESKVQQEERLSEVNRLSTQLKEARAGSEERNLEYENTKTERQRQCEKSGSEARQLRMELEEVKTELAVVREKAERTQRDLQVKNTSLTADVESMRMEAEAARTEQEEQKCESEKIQADMMTKCDAAAVEVGRLQRDLEFVRTECEDMRTEKERADVEHQEQIDSLSAEVSRLQSSLEHAGRTYEELDLEKQRTLSELQVQSQNAADEINLLQIQLQQARSEADRLKVEEQMTRASLQQHSDRFIEEVDRMKNSLDEAHTEITALRTSAAQMKTDFEAEIGAQVADLEEARQKMKEAQERSDEYKVFVERLETEKSEVQLQCNNYSTEVNSLQDNLEVSRSEIDGLLSRVQSLQGELEAECASKTGLQVEFDDLSSELVSHQNQMTKVSKDLANNREKILHLLEGIPLAFGESQNVESFESVDDMVRVLEENIVQMKTDRETLLLENEKQKAAISDLESLKSDMTEKIQILLGSENTLKIEIEELKKTVNESENKLSVSDAEVKNLQSRIEILQDEKEILKSNFDACMVDMQQRMSDQEDEVKNLQSKLVENAKNQDRDRHEIKLMFETHVSELEEKLQKNEEEVANLKKQVQNGVEERDHVKYAFELQISELEDSCHSLEIEKARLSEQLLKNSEIFQKEKTDLIEMHETQSAEFEENCKSLESTMFRLQDQIMENNKSHEQERDEMEKSFDLQLSELEDKCRISDMEVGKLKRQIDEMMKDYRKEKEEMQKMYELQILDLEDRLGESEISATHSKQKVEDVTDHFRVQKEESELQISELEQRCVELERSRDDVQNRLAEAFETAEQERKHLEGKFSSKVTEMQETIKILQSEIERREMVLKQTEENHNAQLEDLKSSFEERLLANQEHYWQLKMTGPNLDQRHVAIGGYREQEGHMEDSVAVEILRQEIVTLSMENASFRAELQFEKDGLNQAKKTIDELNSRHQMELHGHEPSSSTDEATELKTVRKQMETLLSENTNIREELLRERENLQESKQMIEELSGKYMKDLHSEQVVFQQEILELRQKLEEKETEVIQTRESLEAARASSKQSSKSDEGIQDQGSAEHGSGSGKTAELVQMVSDSERKVGDLTVELNRLQSEYETSRLVHEQEVKDLKMRLAGSQDVMRNEGFEPEERASVHEGVPHSMSSFQQILTTVESGQRGESGVSKQLDSSGVADGFEPEVDQQMTDGFRPETYPISAGEFEPDMNAEISEPVTAFHTKPRQKHLRTRKGEGRFYATTSETTSGAFEPETDSFSGEGFEPEVDMSITWESRETLKTESSAIFSTRVSQVHVGAQTEHSELVIEGFRSEPEDVGEGFRLPGDSPVVDSSQPDFQIHSRDIIFRDSYESTRPKQDATVQTDSAMNESEFQNMADMRKEMKHQQDVIEEEYVKKMRTLEVELQFQHMTEKEELKKEMEQHCHQQVSAVKLEKQQAFIKALRKVRKQLEERHRKEIEKIRTQVTSESKSPSEIDEVVHQLRKENQELAEARDALLQQIDMSQNQQTQLEDELQSVRSERESAPDHTTQVQSDQMSTPERLQSDRETFLEELEKLSHQSEGELPLEWELSMSTDDGVFNREVDSVGPCLRPECSVLKEKCDRLHQLLLKMQGDSENLFVEEPVYAHSVNSASDGRARNAIQSHVNTADVESENASNSPCIEEITSSWETTARVENIYADEELRGRIQILETENLSLEQKLMEQLEIFSTEKQNLQQKCEVLQVSLNNTSLSRQEIEQELLKQNDILQHSLAQVTNEMKQKPEADSSQQTRNGDSEKENNSEESVDNTEDYQRLKSQLEHLTLLLEGKDSMIDQLQHDLLRMASQQIKASQAGLDTHAASISEIMKETTVLVSASSCSEEDLAEEFSTASIDRVECIIPGYTAETVVKTRTAVSGGESETSEFTPLPSSEPSGTSIEEIDGDLSGQDPENSGYVQSESHHLDLVEITQLRHDLRKTKLLYNRESALLREALEREKMLKDLLIQSRSGSEEKSGSDFVSSVDIHELHKKLTVLRENNNVLEKENDRLLERVHEQECLVLQCQEKLGCDDVSPDEWQQAFSKQLLLLQKQRDDLLEQIQDGRSRQEHLASVLGEKNVMEETLRREKELLLEKLVQFEELQQTLAKKQSQLERLVGEQKRLEMMLLSRDDAEKQMARQTRLLQERLFDIEGKLREREALLEEEKLRLLREVKEKNLAIKKYESMKIGEDVCLYSFDSGPGGPTKIGSRQRRASTGRLEPGLLSPVGEKPYEEVIEILREKLKLEYEVKEARLEESHAGDMAAFWRQHNEKLESLKSQYEDEMESLRQQLEYERRQKTEEDLQLQSLHKEAVEKLRGVLGDEEKPQLDSVLEQLQQLCTNQIQHLQSKHKEDIELRLQAMKITLDQVHSSQLQLVKSELEAQHALALANMQETLSKQHKDEINRLQVKFSAASEENDISALREIEKLDHSLTEQYKQLVERIGEELDKHVLQGLQGTPSGDDDGEEAQSDRASKRDQTEDIRKILENQREDIAQLRSQLLTEYEALLQSRTQGVAVQSKQVQDLQQEIETLQQQYEEQVKTFQTKLQQYAEEENQRVETQETQEKELEQLRTYYEKHVQDMEKSFSEEVSTLKTKYKDELGKLQSVIEGKIDSKKVDAPLNTSLEFAQQREYIQRTTMLTVISDSEESATESPHISNVNAAVNRVSELEKLIQEKERQISDLEKLLEEEREKVSGTVEELEVCKDKLNEAEKQLDVLKQDVLSKESMIKDLEEEKEKFTKDLEEKESEREQEVDRNELKTELHLLREKFEIVQKQETELLNQLAELDHRRQDELDALRQELEHENKVEIETLQSEFKVQMEIELKRQAAEINKVHEENYRSKESMETDNREIIQDQSPEEREVTGVDSSDGVIPITSVEQVSGANSLEQTAATDSGVDVKVSELKVEYESQIDRLKEELIALETEKEKLTNKHQNDIENMQKQLTEAVGKYNTLMEDIRNGENAEVEEIMKEKYDMELELAKNLMQQEFDETLDSERARFMERHRKMMDDFMSDRSKEAEELKQKQEQEVKNLRGTLTQEYEEQINDIKTRHEEELRSVRDHVQHEQSQKASSEITNDEKHQEGDTTVEKLKQQHEEEIASLRQQYEDKIQDLKTSHSDEINATALDTDELKSDLEAAHQRELEDLEKKLENKHQKELDNLKLQHKQEVEDLERKYTTEVENLHQSRVAVGTSEMEKKKAEEMREVSEVVMPVHTTSLLQGVDLESTTESEMSGVEPDFLMKSTPRDEDQAESERSDRSTPVEMMTTRSFADVVRGVPSISTDQPNDDNDGVDKNEKIKELEGQVETLTWRLQQQEDEEELLAGRRNREAEEDDNLVAMLRSDLERLSMERDAMQRANDNLLQILSDSVKTYVAVEDTINKKLSRMLSQSGTPRSRPPSAGRDEASGKVGHGTDSDRHRDSRSQEPGARGPSPRGNWGEVNASHDSSTLEETSILSSATDEGLDLSQRLTESIFVGPDLDPEGEEIISDARSRLQTSINNLLEMIEKTTQQLLEAKKTHQDLLDTLETRNQEFENLQTRSQDLDERLREEVTAKEYLALELHKAEGLISGYASEREGMDEKIEQLEEQREAMVLELETTRIKLHDFQQSQSELQSLRENIERQQTILHENAGQEMQALLKEVDSLNEEKRELQQQTNHQLDRYKSRVQDLEVTTEELECHSEQQLTEKFQELEDLKLQLENVERQLKANKQFLSEQSAEREQEREEFQREVDRLNLLIQGREKQENVEGRLQREVQDLTEQLQSRMTSQTEILEQTEKLQRNLHEKELMTKELKESVSQLEQELQDKEETELLMKQKIDRLEKQVLLRQDTADLSDRSASPLLDSQRLSSPDLMSPQRRSPVRRQVTLEEEVLKVRQSEEELTHEKEALQHQVREQLLQISALKNQLDDMRHYGGEAASGTHASELRERLQTERESLEKKEQEMTVLEDEVKRLSRQLSDREEEVRRLSTKLDSFEHEPAPLESESDEKIQLIEEENRKLQLEIQKLQSQQNDSGGMPAFAQHLLDEKNQEIDELTEEVGHLQVALEAKSMMNEGSDSEANELDELRAQLKQKYELIAELQSAQSGVHFFGDMSLTDADRNLLNPGASLTERASIHQELEESMAQQEGGEEALQAKLEETRNALKKAEEDVQVVNAKLKEKETELTHFQEEKELKSAHADQLMVQIDSLQEEIMSLTAFQNELQKDFDTVQGMLEEKQREIESLSRESADMRPPPDGSNSDLQENYEDEIESLKKSLQEKENVIEEKEEELYVLNEKLEEQNMLSAEIESLKLKLEDSVNNFESEKNLKEQFRVELEALKEERQNQTDKNKENEQTDIDIGILQMQLAKTDDKLIEKHLLLMELEEKLKAKESQCEKLEEKLREKEVLEMLEKVNDDNKELIEASSELETVRSQNQPDETGTVQLQTRISELEETLKEKDVLLEKYESEKMEKSSLQQTVVDLEEQLQEKEELNKNYEEEKRSLQQSLSEMKESIKDKEESLKRLDEEQSDRLALKENEIAELTEKLRQTLEELSSVKMKSQELKEQMQEEAARLEEEIKRISQVQESQSDGLEDLDAAQKNVEEMSAELSETANKLKKAEDRLTQMSVQLAEREEQIQQMQTESRSEAGTEYQVTSTQSQEELTRTLEEARQEVGQLTAVVSEKEDEIVNLQAALKASKEDLCKDDSKMKQMQVDLSVVRRDSLTRSLPVDFFDSRLTRSESEPGLNIWRRDGDLFSSRLQDVEALARQQKQELAEKNDELSHVRQQLEQWLKLKEKGEGDALTLISDLTTKLQTKEKHIQYIESQLMQVTDTLTLRETEIKNLEEKYEDLQRSASEREVTPPESEQQIRHLKHELQKAKSALAEISHGSECVSRTPEGSASEDEQSLVKSTPFDELHHLKMELSRAKEEVQLYRSSASLSAKDFVKKVMDLREELSEEHRRHIRDIQHRCELDTESELTTMQLKQDDEMKQLQHVQERKLQQALSEQRQELEKNHKTEMNQLRAQHQEEMDRLREECIVREDASVVDLGHRLQTTVSSTEKLDNRLLDHLTERHDGVGQDDADTSPTESCSTDVADENISNRLQALLNRLRRYGVNMLTLSELQFLQRHMSPEGIDIDIDIDALKQAWERERESLLSTINSLKELLSQVHKTRNADRSVDENGDWQADLLQALCNLFSKEREMLLAELRSYVVSHPEENRSTIQKLEDRIQDQESLHRSAIDQIFHADRQSLLSEIRDLHSNTSASRLQQHEHQQQLNRKLNEIEEQSSKKERHLQRQIQVLEYKLQQEKVIEDDLKTSLEMERKRISELSSQLSKERNQTLEIQSELATSQIQLSKAKDALEREQNRYTSVIDALEEEREKNNRLVDLTETEKRKCLLLQSQVDDLKEHNKEKESRFVEQLRIELDREREKRLGCTRHMEQEKSAKASLQQELESERRRLRSVQNEYDGLLAQLKTSLDSERMKCDDLNRSLEREHTVIAQLRQSLEEERGSLRVRSMQEKAVVEEMESELRSQKAQVTDLKRALDREKQKLSSFMELLESERESARQDLETERATFRQLKRELEDSQVTKLDLKRQIEFEQETVRSVKQQNEQLITELKSLKQLENEYIKQTDDEQKLGRKKQRQLERERDDIKLQLREMEFEVDRLRDKLRDSELQTDAIGEKELQARQELERLRLGATPSASVVEERSPRPQASAENETSQQPPVSREVLEGIIQRLKFVTLRIREESTPSASARVIDGAELSKSEESSTHKQLEDLLTEINSIYEPMSMDQIDGSDNIALDQKGNERILQHNANLTSFLSRVCQEKEELRNTLNRLEDEIVQYRSKERREQVSKHTSQSLVEDSHMQEKVLWANERLSLQMSLDAAEREAERLQSEVHYLHSQLDPEGHLMETDREKMQRLYGKYLRSESFRKALVYQKKYLLLLLGGYQDCEQETLMLIAQMGGYPSAIDVQRRRRHPRSFTLFRSAARVIIAISRMRYMVRKWRRATRVGSPIVSGRVNLHTGYMPTTTSYSPPRPSGSPRDPSQQYLTSHQPIFSSMGSEAAVLHNGDSSRQFYPSSSGFTHHRQYATPPTKDPSSSRNPVRPAEASGARRQLMQDSHDTNSYALPARSPRTHGEETQQSLHDDFIERLEVLQQRLGSYSTGTPPSRSTTWR